MRLFAVTDEGIARVESADGERFAVVPMLQGSGAQCVAVDPWDPQRVYVGTFDDGIYRSLDGGDTWEPVGDAIPHRRGLSVAISPSHRASGRSAVYAGTEPSMLYRSEDDGATWQDCPRLLDLPSRPTWSFPPRPWTHHVRWIAPHHRDPGLIFVAIELGGIMRSRDGGDTWEDRRPGACLDGHVVLTHPTAPERVYEAAGDGVALSTDAGDTWRQATAGLERGYVWGLAVDPADPELWYVSAAPGPFQAHGSSGHAQAVLHRKRGPGPWQPLGGTGPLQRPSPVMPYALLAPRGRPGSLLAGMRNGELLLSEDAGDSWRRLEVRLPGVIALADAGG